MFSSDPASGHGAGPVSRHGAGLLAGLGPVVAARRPARPAILSPEEVAAFGVGAALATEWAPLHVEPEAFELPEFDAEDGGALGAPFGPPHDAVPNAAPRPLDALREQARREAEAALHRALAEREAEETELRAALQAEAFAAGVEAGRAEAEAAGHEALASAIEALWIATEEVRSAESRWLAALQDNLAALVAAAARHVIGREVRSDDALVRELAARAVAEFPQDHAVQLRVSPADLDTLRAASAAAPRAGEVRFTADPRVERGGCVVEGRERIVDGRVDTALERVYRRLSGHHA